jgi:hypothetical protein
MRQGALVLASEAVGLGGLGGLQSLTRTRLCVEHVDMRACSPPCPSHAMAPRGYHAVAFIPRPQLSVPNDSNLAAVQRGIDWLYLFSYIAYNMRTTGLIGGYDEVTPLG